MQTFIGLDSHTYVYYGNKKLKQKLTDILELKERAN